jgi:hypothetical protein
MIDTTTNLCTSSARLNFDVDRMTDRLESLSTDSRQHPVLWSAILGAGYDIDGAGHSGRGARTFVEPEWGCPRV